MAENRSSIHLSIIEIFSLVHRAYIILFESFARNKRFRNTSFNFKAGSLYRTANKLFILPVHGDVN